MGIVPKTNTAKIAFFETHLNVWGASPEAIGLEPAQVAELSNLTNAARAAFEAALAARDAARAATAAQNDAIDAMARFGGDLVKTIRAFAETTDNPNVYVEAQIPAPRPATPLGPAETPAGLAANITNTGAVNLTWSAAASQGRTGFVIERRTSQPGQAPTAWTLVGTATNKSFLDEAVPTGLESAQYRVTAERPGGRSQPTEPIVVLFGTGGGSAGEGLRIAA